MADNSQNENGFQDEDDDFGDFGGFEAADPVDPNAPQVNPDGTPAVPTQWAAMFSAAVPGSRNVQPDLLCGQNRFPQHLDNPLTVDVAGSAEASVPPPQDDFGPEGRANGVAFHTELNFDTDEGASPLNLDHISLANDILDGSFRSSGGSQSGTGLMSHGHEQLPDISGLDLALGISTSSINRTENVNTADLQSVNAESPSVPTQRLNDCEMAESRNVEVDESSARANQNADSEDNVAAGVIANTGASGGGGETPGLRSLQQRANEEKAALQKELESRMAENVHLTEDLARAHDLAEAAKQSYESLQKEHEKQLEDLRQAGHQTLTMVVTEYKELLSSTMLQQQEMCEHRFIERLKEETEQFKEMLKLQKEEFDNLQKEERRRNEERLTDAVEEMRQKQQEQFEKQLSEERQKSNDAIKETIKKERESSATEITKVIEEERRKAADMLEKEQENFRRQQSAEMLTNKEEIQKALKEQKEKYQDELASMLVEERSRSRESVQQSVQVTRDDMHNYLEQQRQSDRAQQRRQLASLDLFLESARHQLTLLMNNNTGEESAEAGTDTS